MPQCPKCGTEVDEEMGFCPKCGAPLKAEQPREYRMERRRREKEEKGEKHEKREKEEKTEKEEKHEKREYGFIGPLVGGLILIFVGLLSYLQIAGYRVWEYAWAGFLILIGVLIIIGGVYAVTRASRRHPKT